MTIPTEDLTKMVLLISREEPFEAGSFPETTEYRRTWAQIETECSNISSVGGIIDLPNDLPDGLIKTA